MMGQTSDTNQHRGFGDTNIVMLGAEDEAASEAPLAEATFTLEVEGVVECGWTVRRFEVAEALSALYTCVIDLVSESFAVNPDALLGCRAVLRVLRDALTRRFYGLVRRVEHRGTTGTHRLARAYLVPALWTLSQRSNSRVFQGMTAVDVVRAVLQEAGLYTDEHALQLRLQRQYPTREYCVQYRETDLAFVMRLLEAEGVSFFFRHEEGGESLVLGDGGHAWDVVPTADDGAIPIAGAEGATHRHESVRSLTWEREERPTAVMVRDYDFTRPGLELGRMTQGPSIGTPRELYEPTPALTFERYWDAAYRDDDAKEQAQMRFEAENGPGTMGRGEGRVVGMSPGATFAVGLPGTHLNRRPYLVTLVEHTGEAEEELVLSTERDVLQSDRYRNRFECRHAENAYRPERKTPRPVISGLQTAVVTGPEGEEVYTDEHGRVRVRFHWDRHGPRDESSSCWLRAMQGPWSGSGWGFQFIPRVGMEVVVSFLEGDPDRPVILGALYNGTHPPPFALPQERSRAGVRTQSIGGDGYNELSFEDRGGHEQVFLRAQRDLQELVRNDHHVLVGRDETVEVRGSQRQTVTGSQSETIVGDQTLEVGGVRREVVKSHRTVRVRGDEEHRIEGQERISVRGDSDRFVVGDVTSRVSGRWRGEAERSVDQRIHGDATVRVHGHHTTVVGQYGAPRSSLLHVEGSVRSWSSHATEITADKSIVLRCGDSFIRITPKRIEIGSPEVIARGGDNLVSAAHGTVRVRAAEAFVAGAPSVTMKSRSASLQLGVEAILGGAKVNLGTTSIPLDDDPASPTPLTTIALVTHDGRPIPGQRFVIRHADGTEQAGVVNHEGKAVVELDGVGTIEFPELIDLERE